MLGSMKQLGTVLIKLAIISHGKSAIHFERAISLLRKLTRDFLFLAHLSRGT